MLPLHDSSASPTGGAWTLAINCQIDTSNPVNQCPLASKLLVKGDPHPTDSLSGSQADQHLQGSDTDLNHVPVNSYPLKQLASLPLKLLQFFSPMCSFIAECLLWNFRLSLIHNEAPNKVQTEVETISRDSGESNHGVFGSVTKMRTLPPTVCTVPSHPKLSIISWY